MEEKCCSHDCDLEKINRIVIPVIDSGSDMKIVVSVNPRDYGDFKRIGERDDFKRSGERFARFIYQHVYSEFANGLRDELNKIWN